MNKQFFGLLGLVLAVGSIVGCASRTKIVAGPVQVSGQVEIFDEPQEPSFEFTLDKIGFTLGWFGWEIDSFVGKCVKVLSLKSSTGDPAKVFDEVPPVGDGS